jgi:glycosyltransferase involved in cell wall biosynthesis
MNPFISICIPAYKRVHYLQRLLDSVSIQTYKNFEIVVTDDSPGDEVKILTQSYRDSLPLRYFKNQPALGTPENWNEAIRRSTGDWIKIMHDDDWFTNEHSLLRFSESITKNTHCKFYFSAYTNIHEQENNQQEPVQLGRSDEYKLRKNRFYLFRKNYIGNPSCTLFRKDLQVLFDRRFHWVVDFEFYIRYLGNQNNDFTYINDPLVNVSVNSTQVTKSAFRERSIEVPENHLLISEIGADKLSYIYVYDYYWRLYRNLGIRNESQIRESGYAGPLQPILRSMIHWQKLFPGNLLKFGPLSKSVMGLHYFTHASALKRRSTFS